MTQLEQLKKFTTIVVDTSDFQEIKAFTPQDATTNPSLILKSIQKDYYKPFLQNVIFKHRKLGVSDILDQLLVDFGIEILKIIPGRISTETDARLSFDTNGTINKARTLIRLYETAGIQRERILIKIASTWEGILAAQILETEGIHCNMTLLFGLPQAIACADANVKLISPFVGRIYDWYKKSNKLEYITNTDPGVQSIKEIYNYYRKFSYKTEIMGASFRNTTQIIELAGCDLLTISLELLQQLNKNNALVIRKLGVNQNDSTNLEKIKLDQKSFRFLINEDAMMTEKLAEGIRLFCADTIKLEKIIQNSIIRFGYN